jgi:hypothetical protein
MLFLVFLCVGISKLAKKFRTISVVNIPPFKIRLPPPEFSAGGSLILEYFFLYTGLGFLVLKVKFEEDDITILYYIILPL